MSKNVLPRWTQIVFLPVIVGLLAGCSLLVADPDDELSFDAAKAVAVEIRDTIAQTLPESDVLDSSDDDTTISCGGDAAQSGVTRTFTVTEGLDRVAWLESVSADFRAKTGWRVEDKVAADGSSDAITAVSAASEDGYYIRVGQFAARDGEPAHIVVSASSPCTFS
jgi:hypothetical protein